MEEQGSLGIIALVPDRWQGLAAVRHHVLRRLAQRFPVEWVEPAVNWREFVRPSQRKFLARDRWSEPEPSLEVLTTGFRHPLLHRPSWAATASMRSRLALARRRLVERGAHRIALYIWREEFAEALDLVPHDFSCYHIDDEYSFSDIDLPNSPREIDLIRRVDQVIVHSRTLFEKKGGINPNTALVPNGADYSLFSTPHPAPADLASIPHPRIGYTGVLKKQLDLALLVRLAEARPHWSFVLVGPILNVEGKQRELATLRRMNNVHLLGQRPQAEIPGYVQHFDVCLLCYDLTGYTRYIFPLKLHEYLAAGRPTVSSPVDAMRDFAHVVPVVNTDAEWLAAIEEGLQHRDDSVLIEARRAVARSYDWDLLVEKIARLFPGGSGGAAALTPHMVQESNPVDRGVA
jgi:glycosyltransferase involved in cell wall biosynthesis